MQIILKGSFFSLFETFDSVSLDSGLDFELERVNDDDVVNDDDDDVVVNDDDDDDDDDDFTVFNF